MSTVDLNPIATWVISLLEAGTQRPVGDHRLPDSVISKEDTFPYAVMFLSTPELYGSPLWHPDDSADIMVQVNSVGIKYSQVRMLSDRVRRTFLARTGNAFQVNVTDPTGYHIADRTSDPYGSRNQPISEGDEPNRVYTVPERFLVRVVPS